MSDYDHFYALQRRLSNERARLAAATTDAERELRTVWVNQLEKEVNGEADFLINVLPFESIDPAVAEMTDDELMAELLA